MKRTGSFMEDCREKLEQREEHLAQLCRKLRDDNRRLREDLRTAQALLDERTKELKGSRHDLSALQHEIDEEMGMAKSVQEGLMPKELPEVINVKLASMYMPTGKVGGDLYDVIITPRQRIAILIFDVSGHGVPAALIGAMAKMLFAHFIEQSESPAQVFRDVNEQLCRFIHTEQYLTAFLGILDPIRNVMTYSRAGHVPPVIFHARSGLLTRLESKGYFIGHSALRDLVDYTEDVVHLEAGDKVLFYTDGLTEGSNPRNVLYGIDRLTSAFAQCGSLEVNSVLESVLEDQTRFRQGFPLRDDFTMLCIELGSSEQLLAESGFSREDEPQLLMASTFNDIEKISSIVLRDMDRCGFKDKEIKQFKICIFEMITNALIHGNRGDASKKVFVFYKVALASATVSVVDEGEGFNYRQLPDPLLPQNRIKDHGRGIFIVRHYMDEVQFNVKGNRILGRKFHRKAVEHGNYT
jgi:serine phosphatase RsbU (regulator of sigma subunit)/anti-sigma regulatory factor (Ser/Thr protein kinase)